MSIYSTALAELEKLFLDEKERQSQGKVFRLDSGRNQIRLVPPLDGKEQFKKVGVHFKLGEDGKQVAFCPRVTGDKPCPICEAAEDSQHELAGGLKVRKQFLCNIIDRNQEERGPQVFPAPLTVWMGICELLFDKDDPLDLVDDEEGRDLWIDKSGEGIRTRYSVRAKMKPSPLGEEAVAKDWIAQQPDLEDYVARRMKTFEELSELLPAILADREEAF